MFFKHNNHNSQPMLILIFNEVNTEMLTNGFINECERYLASVFVDEQRSFNHNELWNSSIVFIIIFPIFGLSTAH